MKNKKFIRILLPLVMVVWGLIFLQIRKAVNNGGKPVPIERVDELLITENQDTITYRLKLDYEDPFLKKRPIVHIPPPTPEITKEETKSITVSNVQWPEIVYNGLIYNKKGDNTIYLVEVDGASLFMSPGEVMDDLKLLKVYRDSVEMEYKGDEKRTFVKQ